MNITSQVKEIKFGLKAGVNFLIPQDIGDQRTFKGSVLYHMGVVPEIVIGIKKKFSIQPELLFSAQGFKEKYFVDTITKDNEFEEKFLLGYFHLPVISKYKISTVFSIEAGPYLGYLLFDKRKLNVIKGSVDDHPDQKYKIWNKDFGLIFGINYIPNKLFNINLRYNCGLFNIVEFTNYRTQMIQLSILYSPKLYKVK